MRDLLRRARYFVFDLGLIVAFAVVPMPLTASVNAQSAEPVLPSPKRGHEFAQRFCKGCHLIDGSAGTSAPAGVPTFRAIANRPGQTGQRIMNILINPHPPMPDVQLSSGEIGDIVAYLELLRTDPSIPPLLSPTEQAPKPTYPVPS